MTTTRPTPDDLATPPAADELRVYESRGRESTPKQYGDPPLPGLACGSPIRRWTSTKAQPVIRVLLIEFPDTIA